MNDKLEALSVLMEKYGVTPSEIAFIGDDINDIPVLRKVGVPVCPNDAIAEVKEVCDIVTQAKGGQGVVREFVELLRSHWDR